MSVVVRECSDLLMLYVKMSSCFLRNYMLTYSSFCFLVYVSHSKMSTASSDTYYTTDLLTNLSVTPNRTDESVNSLENGTANRPGSTPTTENNEVTWIKVFLRCDEKLSGSLLHICYRIIDIILLFIGLSSAYTTCNLTNKLATTSICLLIFYFIDLIIISVYLLRSRSPNHSRLTEEEKSEQFRRISALRGFFIFFKLIPVCFGTGYTLTEKLPETNNCELMRFCLGIVCVSTLLIMIMPPTKPVMPPRRSFLTECFLLSFLLIINGAYFTTIGLSLKNTQQQSSCIYKNIEDIYLRAPLISYAYVGIILFSFTTGMPMINVLVSRFCQRLTNGRRLYAYYYAVQYTLNYFAALTIIYYLSVGALLLFQPRSGQPCRADAPGLYRSLLIWQWIRILTPLIAVPLVIILCCLGVFFGFILSYCLPASITVPLLEVIRVR